MPDDFERVEKLRLEMKADLDRLQRRFEERDFQMAEFRGATNAALKFLTDQLRVVEARLDRLLFAQLDKAPGDTKPPARRSARRRPPAGAPPPSATA